MNASFQNYWSFLSTWLRTHLGSLTRPASASLALASLSDLARSKSALIAENALLRQQLIVLRRQVKQPQLTAGDRLSLILLARWTPLWKSTLHLVQPETLLRWHRDLFRGYWRRKSKPRGRKPRIPQETIALIKQMAEENRLWGAERIRRELLKLGIRVSKRTVQRHLPARRSNTAHNWATFLKNHAGEIWACDFTVVHDLLFRPLYVFVIIELQSRQLIHQAVTSHPTDAWVAQQLREATAWGKHPKHLIHDRDSKYGSRFSTVAASTGIHRLVTPYRAPRANAICERFIGSLKRECLDQMLILHQPHLRKAVKEYVHYYNRSRPHQGIEQRTPVRHEAPPPPQRTPTGKVIRRPVLGGLHHAYTRTTYLN